MQSDLYSMSLLIGKKCVKGIAGDSNNPISWLSHFQCTIKSTPWVMKPGKKSRFLYRRASWVPSSKWLFYLSLLIRVWKGMFCVFFQRSHVEESQAYILLPRFCGDNLSVSTHHLWPCAMVPVGWYHLTKAHNKKCHPTVLKWLRACCQILQKLLNSSFSHGTCFKNAILQIA